MLRRFFMVLMLTSTCAHAHIKGFYGSLNFGGFYLKGKGDYKREDVKKDALDKELQRRKNFIYPPTTPPATPDPDAVLEPGVRIEKVTAENYNPDLVLDDALRATVTKEKKLTSESLTSPALSKAPGEKENWQTFTGTTRCSKVGVVGGASLGYTKWFEDSKTFAGGEVSVEKPAMTVKYDLKVKENDTVYGVNTMKPGLTCRVVAMAGKAINRKFGAYVQTGMEFTDFKMQVDANNDSPKLKAGSPAENLKARMKPVLVGVGGMMVLSKNNILCLQLDLLKYSQAKFRDDTKPSADNRIRGHLMSGTAARISLRFVRTFG